MQKIEIKRLPSAVSKKAKGLTIACVLLLMAGYVTGEAETKMKADLKTKSAGINNYSALVVQEDQLRNEFELKKSQLDDSEEGTIQEKITKEFFIKHVGKSCKETNTDLVSLTGGTTTTINDSLSEISFQLELTGDLESLDKFTERLEGLKAVYIINRYSLRKTDEFAWLDRDLDGMSGGNWFDKSAISAKSAEDLSTLGTKDIYGKDELRMFIDISFIAVGE